MSYDMVLECVVSSWHRDDAYDLVRGAVDLWTLCREVQHKEEPMTYEDFGGTPLSAPILVWRFYDAPKVLRDLSNHGGDEDWLALVPSSFFKEDSYIGWMEGNGFGCCDVSEHILEDGSKVYIGAHA